MWLAGWCVGAFVLAWPLLRSRQKDSGGHGIRPDDLPAALWFLVVAYGLAAPLMYLTVSSYWDHLEPAMTMKSLALTRGEPLYPSLTDSSRTQLVYGPAAYLAQSWLLRLFSDPVLGSKWHGVLCGWAAMGALICVWARHYPWPRVRFAAFYGLAILLLFPQTVFRFQADSVVFLGIAIATGAVTAATPALRSGLWALGLALAFGTKLHAALYMLPLVPAFIKHDGGGRLIMATAAGALLALAPFTQPWADFASFADVVDAVSGHRWSAIMLVRNLCVSAVISIPLVVALLDERDEQPDRARQMDARLTLAAVGLSMLFVSMVAAKEGAGTHHLMPFAATSAGLWMLSQARRHDATSLRASSRRQPVLRGSLLVACLIAVLVQAAAIQRSYVYFVTGAQDGRVAEEAVRIRDSLRGRGLRIGLGYSDDAHYGLMWVRPQFWPITSGNTLEPLSIADLQRAGHELAPSTLDLFGRQDFDMVILPRGGEPFSMSNWYDPRQRLFGSALAPVFRSNYQVHQEYEYFILWRANRLADRGSPH